MAGTTGLRRGELKQLVWGDVDFEEATVRVRASVSKNRKKTVLPLPEGTLEALRKIREGKGSEDKVFASLPIPRTLYKDLQAAGIERETSEGVFDFHAFRVTYATTLARADVSEERWLILTASLQRHWTKVSKGKCWKRLPHQNHFAQSFAQAPSPRCVNLHSKEPPRIVPNLEKLGVFEVGSPFHEVRAWEIVF